MFDKVRGSSDDIRALLRRRGWSQRTAAARLGISIHSMNRYCARVTAANFTPCPPPVWNLLLLIAFEHPKFILVARSALYDEALYKPPG